ncbi:MAG: cupin [Robiginitomaculum sp.]|nr:MAG: cupin [Robiginitomaculum sp.]
MSKPAPFHTDGQEFWTDERCFITELVNHDACPELSLATGRVEAGVTTQLHALGVEEVYTIKEGAGRLEVDGGAIQVGIGDSVRIAAGLAQRITNTGDGDLIFYLVCRPRFEPKTYINLEDET